MRTAQEITCQELVELVTDYLEGALPEDDVERFDAHLQGCPGCRAYLDQMRTTIRLVQATAELEQRPEVAGLMRVFSDWKRQRA